MNKLIKLLAAKKIDEQAINEALKQIDNDNESNIVELSVVEKIQLHEILYSGIKIEITKENELQPLLSDNDINKITQRLDTDYKELKDSIMDIANPEKYKTPTISPEMVHVGLWICLFGLLFGMYHLAAGMQLFFAVISSVCTLIFTHAIVYGFLKEPTDELREIYGYAQQDRDIKSVTEYRKLLNSSNRDHIGVINAKTLSIDILPISKFHNGQEQGLNVSKPPQ